jgi:hypothetical protein
MSEAARLDDGWVQEDSHVRCWTSFDVCECVAGNQRCQGSFEVAQKFAQVARLKNRSGGVGGRGCCCLQP